MVGSVGYILLNVINGAYLHYSLTSRRNLEGLATAVVIFVKGKFMHKLHKPFLAIGKKYTVGYIKG